MSGRGTLSPGEDWQVRQGGATSGALRRSTVTQVLARHGEANQERPGSVRNGKARLGVVSHCRKGGVRYVTVRPGAVWWS